MVLLPMVYQGDRAWKAQAAVWAKFLLPCAMGSFAVPHELIDVAESGAAERAGLRLCGCLRRLCCSRKIDAL